MPIKGTSEIRRLPRLGKIHLGIKKESPRTGNPYPEATDYFVVPEEVAQIYGGKPTELKIVFPTEEAPQQWLKRYSLTRGLVCRGDGEKAIAQVDLQTGEIATRDSEHTILKEVTCDPENCPAYKAKQCRPLMTLQFLLPEVPGALGVYQLDTSSRNSIININSTLELVKACGRVRMIPLILKLVPLEVQPEGKKKTVHVLQLVSPYTFYELLQLVNRSPNEIFLLPAPEEPPDDLYPDDVIADEGTVPPQVASAIPAEELLNRNTSQPEPNPLQAWAETVELFKEVKPEEKRVQNWWMSAYKLEVTNADFKKKAPAQKFGAEMIITFRDKLKQLKEEQEKSKLPF
jgi:hypothetical protein